jgi:2,3-diaminopropionate biosynthesis protein SbnA
MAAGILATIGKTPMIELTRIFPGSRFHLFAKLEGFNPGGSAKDRPALAILEHGLETGAIRPGTVLIESSSGNMGIGLAQACRYYGLRFICVVDPRTAPTNLRMLQAYGAEVDYVAEPDPVTGDFLQARLDRVQVLLATIDDSLWTNQYANRVNAQSHYRTTIREVVDGLAGRFDFLFVAVSTCGTIRGCAEYLREVGHPAKVVAVDAVGSVIFGGKRGKRLIPGLGAGVRPALCEPALVDECVAVTDADCIVGCRLLVQREAILAGGSSGGVVMAVEKMRERIPDGSTCVAILPDRGERYLETVFDDGWVERSCGAISAAWRPVAGTAEEPALTLAGGSRASSHPLPRERVYGREGEEHGD